MSGEMANAERPPAGIGCLSLIIGVVVLAAIVVLVFFVGIVALGIFAALLVVGLIAFAVDRVLLALSPKRRERRANQSRAFVWGFGQMQPGQVIDATAFDVNEALGNPTFEEQGPEESAPE
jgi:purine-cytosine permease-like protein